MSGVARLFNQTVSVETRTGQGAYGDTYAAAVSVPCFISDQTRLVRNSTAEEVVSSTTLYAAVDAVAQFVPGSRVAVNGRTAFVISVARHDAAGPARIHHAEVHLT